MKYYLRNEHGDTIRLNKKDSPDNFEFCQKFEDYHLFVTNEGKTIDFGKIKMIVDKNVAIAKLIEEFPNELSQKYLLNLLRDRFQSYGVGFAMSHGASDVYYFNKEVRIAAENFEISCEILSPECTQNKSFNIKMFFNSNTKDIEKVYTVSDFLKVFDHKCCDKVQILNRIITEEISQLCCEQNLPKNKI